MLNIKSYLWKVLKQLFQQIASTKLVQRWARKDFQKFLKWTRKVDKDTKNIDFNRDKTIVACKVCGSQLEQPFPKLKEWLKLHRHVQKLPSHLTWKNDKLFCNYCYPSHTEPWVCFDLDSEEFFRDTNVQQFMEAHKYCVEVEFDFA